MERMNRMKTTAFAKGLIEIHMLRRSQVLGCCNNRTAFTYKVATIRLLLKFQVTLVLRGSTRVFAETATRTGASVPRPARQTVLLVERENHVNGGVDFDSIAIEKRRLIAPLTNGIESSLLQQRMARQNFQLLNRAVLTDDGMQAHRAGNAGLARERRIDRLNAIDDAGRGHVSTDPDPINLRLRWGRRSTHAANDATEHAAHGTTSDAARNSTGHTDRAHIRLGVFF